MKKFTSAGFSLLEWLIASALGTLIIAGLMTIYIGIKTNNNRQQVLMDLQDAGRFAVNILNQRIRLAGFTGCADADNPVNQNQAIAGYDSEHLPSVLQNQVIPDTDTVVINSCVSNTQISQNTVLQSVAYFIGDTNRTNHAGQPILALFQKPLDGDRDELVAGVEQMQILYGISAGEGGLLTYYPAGQIVDWQTVRGLQIDLLLNSIDPVLREPEAYYFQGAMLTPADLLLHKAWSTYIYLRERPG